MAKGTVGSIRKVTLAGVSYNVAADADLTFKLGRYDTEAIPTSGDNMMQMTIRAQVIEGVDLVTDAAEHSAVVTLSQSLDDITMSVCTADGSVYRAQGRIQLDERRTRDGKTSLKLIPRNTWESFLN